MDKSNMSNIPGMNAMADTLEFVKNLWGGMKVPGVGMPGMVMPSLSVDEINKQIADLKAVESWLLVNMNMLRATIQALEVQSATLSTLKAMGDNINSAMQNAAKDNPAAREQAAASAAQGADAKAEARRKTRSSLKEEFKTSAKPEGGEEVAPGPASTAAAGMAQSGFVAPLTNPAAWWNLLQDQFKQAVGTAMSTEPGAKSRAASPGRTPSDSTTASKRKPRPKTH
jgi:hypothetical protein